MANTNKILVFPKKKVKNWYHVVGTGRKGRSNYRKINIKKIILIITIGCVVLYFKNTRFNFWVNETTNSVLASTKTTLSTIFELAKNLGRDKYGLFVSAYNKDGILVENSRTTVTTPRFDANGLLPKNYDKNGWAKNSSGKLVHRLDGGKVVYAEPTSKQIVLKSARSTTKVENKSPNNVTISSDGYIHYNGYRLRPNGRYNEYAFLVGNSTLDNLAQQLKKETDYDTLLNIYEWITENISYDTSYSMTDGFIDPVLTYNMKKGVCEDYAGLYAYLAEKNGIDVFYISSGTHGWIETICNGKRLYIDPTWGAGFVNGDTFTRKYRPAWFSEIPLSQVEINENSSKRSHNKKTTTPIYIIN
jgi:hypothetical protein